MARILLAEDYEDLRQMISDLLKQQEHLVEAFDNGLDAQEMLKQRSFDLVILDWDLPEVAGVEVCKTFRSAGGTTPVLLITGKKAISDKEAAFDAGADDYLTKPFHPKELSARVKALLRRWQQTAISAKAPTAEVQEGEIFADRYEIVSILGRGSTGVIYKAMQPVLNRYVAVKVLHSQLVAEEESVARFKREAQAVASLLHPNIISVHDFGITATGVPYLVMDYAEGVTLSQYIQVNGSLRIGQALNVFVQACDALHHSHSRGVIHRDVKPGNMMLVKQDNGDELLKIVDFGIAKILQAGQSVQVTQNGDVLGSPAFMSPEQCMGQPLDARTDIYSLGCVMYAALLGREPFIGENVLDVMYKRTIEDPLSFKQIRCDVDYPNVLEAIVLKTLKRDREQRYQTMQELKEDLQQLACAFF